ncbi:MAG: potassium/proton antiporter, partial [Planctomycetes bacterium]|nr:potassium/proton antiporter [Planctomycetota bacterium]
MTEPLATAVVIALFGALLSISTLLTRVLDRFGIPVVVLAFVARPLAAWACLAFLRWPRKEVLVTGWVGLRG